MTPGELLTQTRNGLHLMHESHFVAAKHYDRLGRVLGGSATIVAAAAGTAALRNLSDGGSTGARMAVALGGAVAAALIALQTFLNYPSVAERHRAVAQIYGALRRDADRLAAYDAEAVDRQRLEELHARWNEVDRTSPSIPARIIKGSPSRIARQRHEMSAARAPLQGPAKNGPPL